MFEWLQKLRERPERQRRFILWVSTVLIMALFIGAWRMFSQPGLSDSSSQMSALGDSPFQQMKDAIDQAKQNIAGRYDAIKRSTGL